ncbi:carbohydrate ABC transporter permease [Kineosporia sp. R_H_3]|uniref:carbohydrate ABC transporter permease n=1 Tax=Kineosporia sp. R_H_3 TaxID=1961848 RepID=UPI000B4B7EAB|nr:sugar ABC transporter permease [Kineosporia sp. R_H_3]
MRGTTKRTYSYWFYAPAGVVYGIFFILPTVISFYFAFTRWDLFESHWIGLDNFRQFFSEQSLRSSLRNTLVYAVTTSGLKVVLGMMLAVLLTSSIRLKAILRALTFFPVLVSTVAVGITFSVLLQPDFGIINTVLAKVGITGPDWLGNPTTALLSVAAVDVWKGVGLATVIYIAGILSIPRDYYEAVEMDGGGGWTQFRNVTLPLARPATFTVILLSFIGGLRSFDLIWTMTGGGPGFASDTIASVIYKQYQAGFYGLSTAGNVVLFVLVSIIIFPLSRYFNSREVDL